MFKYFINSFKRKMARRYTREYPTKTEQFQIDGLGTVEYANWQNLLVGKVTITSGMVGFFRKFVKEGDFIIDIGANVGDTTVPMALAAGKSGLTLGFDPNPMVFKVLQKNAELNPETTNILPVLKAISTDEEEFYYISSEASFSNGAISVTKDSAHGRFVYPEKIKGVNLNTWLEENFKDRLSRLTLIKIDTEGYDKEIIKSIRELLQKYKPVIIAECFGKSTNAEKEELFDVIDALGYDMYYFEDFDTAARTKHLPSRENITEFKDTINIYALPRK